MPFCPSCGAKINEETNYCPECGYGLQHNNPLRPVSRTVNLSPRKTPVTALALSIASMLCALWFLTAMVPQLAGKLQFGMTLFIALISGGVGCFVFYLRTPSKNFTVLQLVIAVISIIFGLVFAFSASGAYLRNMGFVESSYNVYTDIANYFIFLPSILSIASGCVNWKAVKQDGSPDEEWFDIKQVATGFIAAIAVLIVIAFVINSYL